jgi:predicted CoA-substrate-specific enzyme activase
MFYCGIDIGASAAKLILIDSHRQIRAKALRRSGVDYAQTSRRCLEEALVGCGLSENQIRGSLATGYGRDNIPWTNGKMTEIACHGKGAYHFFPRALTVIDIGAQDSKIIHVNKQGVRTNFKMNRKCAAGTGAFLEEIAYRLDLPLADLNSLAERSAQEISLGSFCTVFAATEVLEKIRAGHRVEDIVRGAFRSVVKRVLEMDLAQGELVMTGGVVANNPIITRLVAESFGKPVLVPPHSQFMGAFGAALFALEQREA